MSFLSNGKTVTLCVTAIVLAILGVVGYLAGARVLAGSDALALLLAILGLVGGTGAAHVTGTLVKEATNPDTAHATQIPVAVTAAPPAVAPTAGPAMPRGGN